jgi:anti-sigma regulatory factor (Ser/Thr protein kinase)
MLGSQDGVPAKTQRVSLPPDGAIVLYTDGVIERTRDIARGEADLQAALARWSAANFTARSSELQNELLAGGPRHDDAAMFIVRFEDAGSLDVSLPASVRNATRMRTAFERFARRRGFPEERIFDITLGVAEAINNAAEHAYLGGTGSVRLYARQTDLWLEATISDAGTWREQPSDPDRGRGIAIIRRVFDDVRYVKGTYGTVVSLRARLPGAAQVASAANG